MYTELETMYLEAERLVEAQISPLTDLSEYMTDCRHMLRNPLIWANMELTQRLEDRIIEAEKLLCDNYAKECINNKN
jgi:hypothetical protein